MNITSYISLSNYTQQIYIFKKYNVNKVIVEHSSLSLFDSSNNDIDFDKIESLIKLAHKHNISIVFNVDKIIHNIDYPYIKYVFSNLTRIKIDGIRIKDIGLAFYCKNKFPNLSIELNTVIGNYNYNSVHSLLKEFNNSLDLFVLNRELSIKHIKDLISYTKSLNFKLKYEVHGYGKMLIFYSKRKLLRDHLKTQTNYYDFLINEKKRKDDYYRFIDNNHGSFMFFNKKICLSNKVNEIYQSGIEQIRIDLRDENIDDYENILLNFQVNNSSKNLFNPSIHTEGFFDGNETDNTSNFIKKHERSLNKTGALIGKILSTIKDEIMLLEFFEDVNIATPLLIKTPIGKEFKFFLKDGRYLINKKVATSIKQGDLILFPWKKGVSPENNIYLLS